MENLNLSDLSLKELQQLKQYWWYNSLKEEIHKKLELITQTLGRQIILWNSVQYSYKSEKLFICCKYASGEGIFSQKPIIKTNWYIPSWITFLFPAIGQQ